MRSVSIKIALSFQPALPLQNSFINIRLADPFDGESAENVFLHNEICGGETLIFSIRVIMSAVRSLKLNEDHQDEFMSSVSDFSFSEL